MSIFSKKLNQRSEPEDLDSGYENPYYTVRENRDRTDRRDDRRDDRFNDRGSDYDRRDINEDENDYFETRRAPERAVRGDTYEEEEPRGYRERMYEEEEARRKPRREAEKPAAPENKGTLYYTPESYRDVRVEIVTALTESHVVVINLRNLVDTEEVVRLVDYIMGAVQVLGASLRRMGGNNLVMIPKDVEIDEEDILVSEEEDEAEETDEEYEAYEEYEDYDEDGEVYDEE